MEGVVSSAGGQKGPGKYPLTVSRTANLQDQAKQCSSTPSSSSTTTPSPPQAQPLADHVISKEAGSGRSRFFFESDTLALKNNPDYRQLLKTLAILEAQKMQAIRDMEVLLHAQAEAEKDPLAFVESLKNGTLEPLPRRQQVAELPEIEWKLYIESLQSVAKQHSALHLNTRRQSKPLIASLDEKMALPKSQKSSSNKPASYGQQWTVEEQAKFEELLKIYPPEKVERRRFEKIAKALGTRTAQQVATHVQKYFIKLANAGLPVPGRMPNMAYYTRKKGKGKRSLNRPSTFFSSLTPHVMMGVGSSASSSSDIASSYDSSDEDESFGSDFISSGGDQPGGMEGGEEEGEEFETSGSTSPCSFITCVQCSKEIQHGVYWLCTECPQATPTHLCNDCVNSDYRSRCHSPSHSLQLLSLAPPHTFIGQQDNEATPTCFVDQDYTNFTTHGSKTGYNYLDPNFYPAS